MDSLPVNARVYVDGIEVESQGIMTRTVCSCCSYRASEQGIWPVPLPVIDPNLVETQLRTYPAAPGTGAVREVVIVPNLCSGYACEACADQQCNGCYHCATHCSCPPGTGRPAWILPTAEEVAAMPPLEGPFGSATAKGEWP